MRHVAIHFFTMILFVSHFGFAQDRYTPLGFDGESYRYVDEQTGEILFRNEEDRQREADALLETPWRQIQQHNGILYMLYQSPNLIKRYHLASQSWLSDLQLTESPTAFAVADEGIYISFGRRTAKFQLDGGGEVHLRNTINDVTGLISHNNTLLLREYGSFYSIDKTTGVLVDQSNFWYQMGEVDLSVPGYGFARSTSVSPSDIIGFEIDENGLFGNQWDSPAHGNYPSATRVKVMPALERVVDSAGTVYNLPSLTYANSLAGGFDDIDLYHDLPIILRDNDLIAFTNSFLEAGRYTPEETLLKIYISGDSIFGIHGTGTNLEVTIYDVNLLNPAEPDAPIDPNQVPFTADAVILDRDEIAYVLSRDYRSLFRWSTSEQRYLDTIPLLGEPKYIAYSEVNHRIYLTYDSGAINQIRLDQSLVETPFANLPDTPRGLACAGEFVFTCDNSGAWVSHATYSPDGVEISREEWNYYSREYIWSPQLRKMFFFRDGTSPNDIIWEDIDEDGVIGIKRDSPQHGGVGTRHPIRVAPDASTVLLGSGQFYNPITLVLENALSNDIDGAVWHEDRLFTIRNWDNGVQLQEWGDNYALLYSKHEPGTLVDIFELETGLLLIKEVDGKLIYANKDWDCLRDDFPVLAALPPTMIGCDGDQINLEIQTESGDVTAYQWRRNGVALTGETSHTLSFPMTQQAVGAYDCIVMGCTGAMLSTATQLSIGEGRFEPELLEQWQAAPQISCNDLNGNQVLDILDLVGLYNNLNTAHVRADAAPTAE